MSLTFIDTNKLPRVTDPKTGDFTEILNNALCGAENVAVKLHWLSNGQSFDTGTNGDSHQLYYLMEGQGTIALDGKDYEAKKGMGIYLGPAERATLKQTGPSTLKLLHLTVPKLSH
jgi:mannose-6-phosphate isomerase-like protein (cupin superfamily)